MEHYTSIAEGNMKAFEELVCEYHRPLNAFAFRMINEKDAAQDIVQDVFTNIWFNRRTIDFGESFGGYLYTLTRNASLNYLRKTKKMSYSISNSILSEEMADLYVLEEEFNRQLRNALAQLPPRTAEVISLSLTGPSQEEIARKMNVTVSNVKNLKALGIRKLKDLLNPLHMFILLTLLSKQQ